MTVYDVAGLQPAARAVAAAAAAICVRHLEGDAITIVAHGSAVKGGYLAGCSDIDLRLYVTPGRLTAEGQLPLELALRIYQDVARLDPRPFRYAQLAAHAVGSNSGGGLIPGAYQIIYGDACVPLATSAELCHAAHAALGELDAEGYALRLGAHLLGGGYPHAQELRWLCTDVWPALYHLLVCDGGDPLAVWRLPKPDAIARTAADSEAGSAIRQFWRALNTHYATGETLPTALAALEAGIAFLRAAGRWYGTREHQA
jgi:hypothetical protein